MALELTSMTERDGVTCCCFKEKGAEKMRELIDAHTGRVLARGKTNKAALRRFAEALPDDDNADLQYDSSTQPMIDALTSMGWDLTVLQTMTPEQLAEAARVCGALQDGSAATANDEDDDQDDDSQQPPAMQGFGASQAIMNATPRPAAMTYSERHGRSLLAHYYREQRDALAKANTTPEALLASYDRSTPAVRRQILAEANRGATRLNKAAASKFSELDKGGRAAYQSFCERNEQAISCFGLTSAALMATYDAASSEEKQKLLQGIS